MARPKKVNVWVTSEAKTDCDALRLHAGSRISAPVTAGLATAAAYLLALEEPERFDEFVKSLIRIEKAGRANDGDGSTS